MRKKTTKKRNPQDATLRNIRALKKRLEKLEAIVSTIHVAVMDLLNISITKKLRWDK